MDYTGYAQSKFDRLGLDSPEAKALARQLEEEVTGELHQAIMPVFERIIAGLNSMGHNLTIYGDVMAGDVAYRDQTGPEECHLRLAYDIIVSAGYGHLIHPEE